MKFFSYLKPMILCGLFLLIFSYSCNNSATIDTLEPKAEFQHYENYKQYGTFMYEHLKYNLATVDPILLLPERYRDLFVEKWNDRETKGMNFLESHDAISSLLKAEFIELHEFIEQIYHVTSQPNLLEIANQLVFRIERKEKEDILSLEEKKELLSVHHMHEGFFRYFAETFPYNSDEINQNQVVLRGCNFWEQYSCFWESFGLGIVQGIGAAFELRNFFLTFSAVIPLAVGGAAFGGVRGIVYVAQGDTGPCCDEDLDCKPVMGVSLTFSNCSPTASYQAWGFGPDDSSLDWMNVDGTPTTISTSTPRATISQTGSLPVKTTIISVCSDGSTNTPINPFVKNLTLEVRKILGVSVVGRDEVFPGDQESYSALGIGSNYSVTWIVTGGTFTTSPSGNEIIVNWSGVSPTITGSVQCQVNNNCPNGLSKVYSITVAGTGPPP